MVENVINPCQYNKARLLMYIFGFNITFFTKITS